MGEPESVCRPSDMDLSLGLKLHRQPDGDIIVTIGSSNGRHMGCPDVEICTPGAGGSKSPETWRALGQLFKAMQADAEGRSLAPSCPSPGAFVVSDGPETRERIEESVQQFTKESLDGVWRVRAEPSQVADAVIEALKEGKHV